MISIHYLDRPIVKKHLLISSVGFILGVLLYLFFDGDTQHVLEILLSGLCGIFISYSIFLISRWLDRLFPWKTQLPSRLLIGIFLQFTIVFMAIALLLYLYTATLGSTTLVQDELIADESFNEEPDSFLIKLGIIVFFIVLIYNIVYFALYSYHSYAKGQIEEIAYERKQIDLQLKALKSQLSSHFLFNNLNTISSLVYQDENTAEKFIRGMGTIYNYTLNSYHEKLVDLNEELNCVTSYLEQVRTRFGKNLNYNIDISQHSKRSKIPPLTLQMLVENAVKHNQIDNERPLHIEIKSTDNLIEVKNNITKTPTTVKSFQVGLKNIEARYKLICGKSITILNNSDFIVRVPIIES